MQDAGKIFTRLTKGQHTQTSSTSQQVSECERESGRGKESVRETLRDRVKQLELDNSNRIKDAAQPHSRTAAQRQVVRDLGGMTHQEFRH